MNESQTNGVGNAVSYEIAVANHAKLLLDPEDWPARRAGFLQHDVVGDAVRPGRAIRRRRIHVQSNGSDGLRCGPRAIGRSAIRTSWSG